MQLRRDVYLEAAEGLAAILDFLIQSARPDVPLGKAAAPPGAAAWLFKAYLVATTDTLIAFTEAGAAVAGSALDLLSHRLAVTEIDDEITVARTTVDAIQKQQEQLRAEAHSVDTDKATERSVQRLEWIKQQYDIASADVNSEVQKLEGLVVEHGHRLRALLEQSMRINLRVQQPIRAALLAARSELEMYIDADKFGSAANRVDTHMFEKVNDLLKLINVSSDTSSGSKGDI